MSANKVSPANDPYADIYVEDSVDWVFRPSILMAISYLILLAAVVFLTYYAIRAFQGGAYEFVILTVFILLLVLPWTLRTLPRLVTVTQFGLSLSYFLWKTAHVEWDQIRSLLIRRGRGTWVTLQTDRGNLLFPIETGGIKASRILVKLIIQKAQLTFVRGQSFGNAYYKGNEAELV